MRRIVLVAVASTMMVLASLPVAVAQDETTMEDSAGDTEVNLQSCSIVVNVAENDQYAQQNGIAPDASPQEIAQELNISLDMVQNCIQDSTGSGNVNEGGKDANGNTDGEDANGEDANGDVANPEDVDADTVPAGKTLPDTRGPSLPLLLGGGLLVAVGVIARRVLR